MVKLYLSAVWNDWAGKMSCVALTATGLVGVLLPPDWQKQWTIGSTAALRLIFLFTASYRAWREEHEKVLAEEERARELENKLNTKRPHISLLYEETQQPLPVWENDALVSREKESELLIRNGSEMEAFDIDFKSFTLAGYEVVARPIGYLAPGATVRIDYSVGIWETPHVLHCNIEYKNRIKLLLDKEFETKRNEGVLSEWQLLAIPIVVAYKNADGERFETGFRLSSCPDTSPKVFLGKSNKTAS
jgi:hypothetical protein